MQMNQPQPYREHVLNIHGCEYATNASPLSFVCFTQTLISHLKSEFSDGLLPLHQQGLLKYNKGFVSSKNRLHTILDFKSSKYGTNPS